MGLGFMPKKKGHVSAMKATCLLIALAFLCGAVFSFAPPYVASASASYDLRLEIDGNKTYLRWNNYGTCDGYIVYLNDDLLATLDGGLTLYLDVTSAIAQGGAYTFSLYAAVEESELYMSELSHETHVTLSPATGFRTDSGKVLWDNVSGASSYDVYLDGIFLKNVTTAQFNVSDYCAKNKTYEFGVIPRGANSYYTSPSVSKYDYSAKVIDNGGSVAVNVFYAAGLTASWQPLDGVTSYFYTLTKPSDNTAVSAELDAPVLALNTLTASNTRYTLTVYADIQSGVTRVLDTCTFSFSNGEVTLYD